MTIEIATPVARIPSANPPIAEDDGRRSKATWLVLLGWLAQVVLRVWTSWHAHAPAAFPDEAGYLLAARRLAGGPGGDMSYSTFYQGGYPLLLSPVYWVTADPTTAYRLVMAIGAVIGAAVFPLSLAILRRLGLGPATAFGIAFAVALLPANVFFGAWALTDAILPAVVACWLLALMRFADTGGCLAGSVASLVAAYAYAVHSRGTVILLVHAGVLGFLLVRGWVPRPRTMVGIGVAAVGYVGASRLNTLLLHAMYPDGPRDLSVVLWSRLTSADGLLRTLSGACGQVWYLIVATYGLAGLGLVATVARLLSRRADRSLRLVAAVTIAVTAGIALATTAALPDEHRIGNYAYGRYLACVAIPLSLAGAATLIRAGRRTVVVAASATVGVLAATALAVTTYAGPRLHEYTFIGFDFPETSYLTENWRSFDMLTAGLVASALLGGMILLRRLSVLVVALLLVVNGGFILHARGSFARPAGDRRPALTGKGGVEVARDLRWQTVMDLRYRVGWTTVGWLKPAAPRAQACTVLTAWPGGAASSTWPGHPGGWTVADQEPSQWVAWRREGCAAR